MLTIPILIAVAIVLAAGMAIGAYIYSVTTGSAKDADRRHLAVVADLFNTSANHWHRVAFNMQGQRDEAEDRAHLALESVSRWRQLAVNQQAELRVHFFADDLYPNQPDKRSRLASLLFELSYEETEFTKLFRPIGKQRMIAALKRIMPPRMVTNVERLGQIALSPTIPSSDRSPLERGGDVSPAGARHDVPKDAAISAIKESLDKIGSLNATITLRNVRRIHAI